MASNEWLVRKLHEQDKKIEALSRGGTGVGHTSIAPGENLTVISDNGEVVLGAGGVEHVDGPTPATPSAPTLKLGFGTIETTWDGTFAEGEDEDGVPLTAPVDFDVVEVHCSTDPEEEEWGEDTMRGQIKTREGGTITVGGFDVDDEVFVCLIALAKTGKRSAPSAPASLVIEGLDFSQLFNEIDAANATIKNAGEILVTEQDTLGDKLDDAFGQIEDAITSANGKNVVHYEDSAPTSADAGIEGDTWFVGEFGRPNDVVQATNLILNPSANPGGSAWYYTGGSGIACTMSTREREGFTTYRATINAGNSGYLYLSPDGSTSDVNTLPKVQPGDRISARMKLTASKAGNYQLRLSFRNSSGGYLSFTSDGPSVAVTADGPMQDLVIEDQVAPASAAYVNLHVRANNSGFTGAGEWQEGTRALLVKSSTAPDYFDGDTTDGAGEDDPHYRWVGTPSASVSEKYLPAIPATGSDAWNITQQYKFTDGAWVQVELNHQVISSMDVGKLVAGSAAIKEAVVQKLFAEVVVAKMAVAEQFIGENAILTGAVTAPKITASEELWAKIAQFVKIRAEHIAADAIDGMVITGATYRTSGGSGSWSDAGLFISQPDGTSMVRFPTDGSPLSLTASDTQIERATVDNLDLTNGTIRSGGTFNLASGVTPPASPPEITTRWDKLCTLPKPSERSDYANLAYWGNGNSWVRAINVLGTGEGDRIEIYDNTTGAFVRSFPVKIDARHGVTVISDTVYIFGKDHDIADPRVFIFGYNLNTGLRVSRNEYTRGIQARNALGNDGTNLIIGSVYNLELWVHKWNPATGAQVGSDMRSGSNSWPASGGRDLFGVRISGNDVEVVTSWGGRVYLNSNNALVRKTDSANASGYAGWVLPAHDVSGCVWISGVPYPVDSGGTVYEGSTFGSDTTVQTCFTWYSGGHETTPSAVAGMLVGARESATISVPTRPGLQKRVYYRAGSSGSWTRADLAESVTALNVSGISGGAYSLPTTNSFPNADPAVFRSTNGNVVVRGDGSGKWGPLTFNADGTMSSSQVPVWVPVTTFESGFGPQTFGFAPAYRVWPDGKVEWRGIIAGSMPVSDGQAVLTIPAEARPAQSVQYVAATGVGGGAPGTVRVEYSSVTYPTKLMVLPRVAAITWLSLDGHTYYKD